MSGKGCRNAVARGSVTACAALVLSRVLGTERKEIVKTEIVENAFFFHTLHHVRLDFEDGDDRLGASLGRLVGRE